MWLLAACEGRFPDDDRLLQTAASAYDPAALERNLEDIEAWHREHRTGVAESLREGAAVRAVEATFADSACVPTGEMKTLWSWHDGEDGAAPFIWYHDFLSLEEARFAYDWLLRLPFVRWDPHYVPLFDFEGEWYAAYCGPDGDGAGPIAHFFLEDEPRITAVNLTVFIATMAQALRSGAVSWKDDAMVEDLVEVHRIHQTHNPGYPFPYHVPDGR